VDRTIRRELGASPLVRRSTPRRRRRGDGAAARIEGPRARSRWALLGAAREEDRALAPRLVQTIIAEFDHADERAKESAKPKTESQVVREPSAWRGRPRRRRSAPTRSASAPSSASTT
jgi:hypothetical protein